MSEIISQDNLVAKVQYAKTAVVSSDSQKTAPKGLHMTCALYFVF